MQRFLVECGFTGAGRRQGKQAAARFSRPAGGLRGLTMNSVEQLEFPGESVSLLTLSKQNVFLRTFNIYCVSSSCIG